MKTTEYQNTIFRAVNYINSKDKTKFIAINSIGEDNKTVSIEYKERINSKWIIFKFSIRKMGQSYLLYVTNINNNILTPMRRIFIQDNNDIDYDMIDKMIISLIDVASIEINKEVYRSDI